MGADLYIQPKFEEEYQKRVTEEGIEDRYKYIYDDNPYYFRDSYNNSSVLWKLDLSWWKDVVEYCDDEMTMPPEKAREWLKVIQSHQSQFDTNIAKDGSEEQDYYRNKLVKLQAFYQRAIDEGLSIRHSV
jgi:hypothetical protein